ncbi:MAG: hypothetical protein KBG28_27630 [Kofleriaceae bacterium]|jgi:hypothetical protein|nr:hypothetical protein [Kofleriaceae bacterium]
MKPSSVLVTSLVTLVTLAALPAGPAAAQPAMTAPAAPAPVDADAEREDGPKSPGTALLYSLGGTAAALALSTAGANAPEGSAAGGAMSTVGALGLWLAPSFGHWYAGNGFTKGLGLRLAGGGVATLGIIGFVGCAFSSGHGDGGSDCTVPGLLMLSGAGMFVGGAAHDIATAPREARRYNARHAAARRYTSVQAVPALVSAGGARAPGLGLAGTF